MGELGDKVFRLNQTKGASELTFGDLATRWLANHRFSLKEKSVSRLDTCLKGLKPYFGHVPLRNIGSRHCEAWLTKRGKAISASSYKHERRVLLAVLDCAVRDGLLLDNPARTVIPIRKIPKSKLVIPAREQLTKLGTGSLLMTLCGSKSAPLQCIAAAGAAWTARRATYPPKRGPPGQIQNSRQPR